MASGGVKSIGRPFDVFLFRGVVLVSGVIFGWILVGLTESVVGLDFLGTIGV